MSKKLIFIFSLPRSGSTLLQKLLMTHSKIDSVSEPWILLPYLYTLKSDGIFTEYSHTTCYMAIQDFIDNLPNKERDYLDAMRSFFLSLYEKVCDPNAEYFLDKTPRYYLIIPLIAKLFPDAKFIFLFRNPLEVLASIIETWGKGRLRIHGYYIDLYKGPRLLAEGYENLKRKSIKVIYTNLVRSPEDTLHKVFEYLGLEFESNIIDNFNKSSLKGRMGDPEIHKFTKIETSTLGEWKKVLVTRYRRSFARKYLNYLGKDILNTFGFDLDELLDQLQNIKVSNKHMFSDMLYFYGGTIYRILELSMQKRRFKNKFQHGERLYLHS